jgi:transposase
VVGISGLRQGQESRLSARIVDDAVAGTACATAPDLPPEPGVHATFARDHEYKRHGTLSLLAGIDLLTGKVHALVRDRHRSREFIEFLRLLDAAYPASTAIKLILDNHSAHISKETRSWLATRPTAGFEFTFTPIHGSWLNLIEGFFSKFARSVLRHIRVPSKQELRERIMAGIDDINRHPVGSPKFYITISSFLSFKLFHHLPSTPPDSK